jgi:hypothetical protein
VATARLLIAVEGGADARRAFGQIASEHRRASAAMSTEARRASQERQRAEREEVAAARRDFQGMVRDRQRAERESVRAALQASRERARGERTAQAERARGEREQTRIAAAEARARTRAEAEEVREATRNARAIFRARAQAERDATRVAGEERARRTRDRRDVNSAVAGYGGAVASGARAVVAYAISGAEALHEQRQQARQTRAGQVREFNGAMLQTGASAAEIGTARARMEAFALREGIPFADLVAAASQAQTAHSALAGPDAATRASRMEDFLRTARDAYVMHQDVGQSTTFAAMLGQQGIRGDAQRQMVSAMTQISFNGAVELGDALRQGLGPMLQYVNAQVARAPAGADRQAVYRQSMLEFYAAQQAERASGNTVRWSGGRLAHLDTALGNQHTQDLLHGRLLATVRDPAQRARIAEMFTTDAQGHHALTARFRNIVNFTERATELYGGNSERFANAMAAGGHGVPQVLQQPDVQAMRALMGADAEHPERHVYDSLRDMYNNATMSPQTRQTAEDLTRNEAATELNRNEEARMQALTSNTGAITAFSDRLAAWMAANPVAAQYLGTSGSGAVMAAQENTTARSRSAAAMQGLSSLGFNPLNIAAGLVNAGITLATGGHDGPARRPGDPAAFAWLAPSLERAVASGMLRAAPQMQVQATVNPADAHIAAGPNNRPPPSIGQ